MIEVLLAVIVVIVVVDEVVFQTTSIATRKLSWANSISLFVHFFYIYQKYSKNSFFTNNITNN